MIEHFQSTTYLHFMGERVVSTGRSGSLVVRNHSESRS